MARKRKPAPSRENNPSKRKQTAKPVIDPKQAQNDTFIRCLSEGLLIAQAAKVAGIGRRTAFDRRAADPAFAERWADAVADAVDELEAGLDVLAKADDLNVQLKARLALLRARRPETFGDKKRDDADEAHQPLPKVAIKFYGDEAPL
jgi:hypothetical protein